jgi:glutamate/aspartate transport system substrate-binding protein
MRKGVLGLVALLVAALAASAFAQDEEEGTAARALAGTLRKVRDSGVVMLGYRDNSFPFSYLAKDGVPIGYSLELCRDVVDDIAAAVDRPLAIRYVAVTPETRMPMLTSGKIDLECGSTTANTERRKQVAFSPVMFVAGTKLLVRRDSGLRSIDDLRGRPIAVTAGTTNEAELRKLSARLKLDLKLTVARDHDESFGLLAGGKVDAFATDDILLYGLVARKHLERSYVVVGDFLSYDPYALMYRRDDPQLAEVVDATFRRLAESRALADIYVRWFERRLPDGELMKVPMSPQLRELFAALGLAD